MRRVSVLVAMTLVASGCASQRDTGAALVTAGALAAGIGASAASNSRCSSFGCYPQQGSKTGAKIALAGLAVAAAGYAIAEAARRQDRSGSRPSDPPSDPNGWRLVRRDPDPAPVDPAAPGAPPTDPAQPEAAPADPQTPAGTQAPAVPAAPTPPPTVPATER